MAACSFASTAACSRFTTTRRLAGSHTRGAPAPCRPARFCRARSGGSGGGASEEDAGSAFVQRFRSLSADVLDDALPLDVAGGGGCCGGSAAADGDAAQASSGSGCCGGSSAASGPAAASAVSQQLNNMMAGMEGTLTREDLRAAFEAGPARGSSAQEGSSGSGVQEGSTAGGSGERFLDVAAILRGEGGGGADEDAELDALVV